MIVEGICLLILIIIEVLIGFKYIKLGKETVFYKHECNRLMNCICDNCKWNDETCSMCSKCKIIKQYRM